MFTVASLSTGRWRLWAALGLSGVALLWGHGHPPRQLAIDSNPTGATVYFDGHRRGVTPCTIRVGSRGRLRLEYPGYLPAEEFLRLDEPVGQQMHLRMRPGVAVGQLRPDYPPSLGHPPATRFWTRNNHLAGHVYTVPPGWRSEAQLYSLQLSCGDGRESPLRQASLAVMPGPLAERWRQLQLARELQGWTVVASQLELHSGWIRLERVTQLCLSRSALLLKQEGNRLLELDYRYPDCADIFTYTRDLDYLRAALL